MNCRGPRVAIYDEDGHTRVPELIALSEEIAVFRARSPKERPQAARELRSEISRLQAEGYHFFRRGCGQDLAEIIARVPEDGNEYLIQCPRCGTQHPIEKIPIAALPAPAPLPTEPTE